MDDHLSAAVKEGTQNVSGYFSQKGIKTLKDSAMALYESGETSYEEILPLLNESI
jgi:general secretion pathway protein E/type IV pilus assembly protein PilB